MSKGKKAKRDEDGRLSAEVIAQAELAMKAELTVGRASGAFWKTRFEQQAQTDAGKISAEDAAQQRADADEAILNLTMDGYTANRAVLMKGNPNGQVRNYLKGRASTQGVLGDLDSSPQERAARVPRA